MAQRKGSHCGVANERPKGEHTQSNIQVEHLQYRVREPDLEQSERTQGGSLMHKTFERSYG